MLRYPAVHESTGLFKTEGTKGSREKRVIIEEDDVLYALVQHK